MSDTTAKINAKGLDGTGFTEELAGDLFNKVGTHLMAVVDLQVVDRKGPNLKGKRGIELVIGEIEIAPNETVAEHLRELNRSFYYERQLAGGQAPTLPLAGEGAEPDVETVLAAGAKHRHHPYLASTLSLDDNAICDVCGQIEAASVHSELTALEPAADQELEDEDEDTESDADEHDEDELATAIDDAYDDTDQDADEDEPVSSGVYDPFA